MKARFISSSVIRISYICVLLTLIHHILLHLTIFNQSGDIEKKNLDPGLICVEIFTFVNEI